MKKDWDDLNGQKAIDYFKELNKNRQTYTSLMGSGNTALDFGAGVGRNINSILENFNSVVAYDLPNVVELLDNFDGIYDKSKTTYTSDWLDVSNKNFDCIYIDSVFHHIEKDELLSYLADMSKMTDKMIVNERRLIDDKHRDILPILNKYFHVNVLKVHSDPYGFEMFVAELNKIL